MKNTKISWTTHTWNPWIGCTKVSPGCKNCYAERLEKRAGRDFFTVRRAKAFDAPLRWTPERSPVVWPDLHPEYVFTCSMSDFFHEKADPWRDEAWEIIRRTPWLTYQILTKRPERIAEHLPKTCFNCGENIFGRITETMRWAMAVGPSETKRALDAGEIKTCCGKVGLWPWPNVWLGTSVETQQFAEKRIYQLVNVPAKVHFLSCEPLLGPIDFGGNKTCPECFGYGMITVATDGITQHPPVAIPGRCFYCKGKKALFRDIEWVIVGGESGPGYREMNLDWARNIRDQCRATRTPFFFKQTSGARSEMPSMDPDLDCWKEMP